jgi:hypothetical protein
VAARLGASRVTLGPKEAVIISMPWPPLTRNPATVFNLRAINILNVTLKLFEINLIGKNAVSHFNGIEIPQSVPSLI